MLVIHNHLFINGIVFVWCLVCRKRWEFRSKLRRIITTKIAVCKSETTFWHIRSNNGHRLSFNNNGTEEGGENQVFEISHSVLKYHRKLKIINWCVPKFDWDRTGPGRSEIRMPLDAKNVIVFQSLVPHSIRSNTFALRAETSMKCWCGTDN